MLLAVDIGNTHISLGLYDGKKPRLISRLSTVHTKTRDQYAVDVKSTLALYNFDHREISGAVVSSVVPEAGQNIARAINMLCSATPLIIGPGVKTGLNIKIDNPAQLGSDMVISAVAAISKYPLPAIIFDFGTATKISVLNDEGSFIGCAITVGISVAIEALPMFTSTLPKIAPGIPKNIIGTNTVDSMKSGIIYGNVALIDGMSDMIEKELGQKAAVILTGRSSHLLKDKGRREVIFDDSLSLEGLRLIYERNKLFTD